MGNFVAAIVAVALSASTQPASPFVDEPAPPTEAPTAQGTASPTAAPTAGADIVHLVSGGFVRGTVEEYEPGGTVVLLKSDGTRKTFEATEVSRVDIGGQPAPAEPAEVLEAPAVDPEPSPIAATARSTRTASDKTRLHLVRKDGGSSDFALHRKTADIVVSGSGGSASGIAWETTCRAPCGKTVDTEPLYFVGRATGLTLGSKPVDLRAYEGGDVTLEVEGGSRGLFAGGYSLVFAGSLAAASSTVWFMLDDLNNGAGGAMLAAGVAGFVGGFVMVFRSRHRVTPVSGRPRR
ncbi:MAG: hypothetical protein KUG77_27800 [Nannocystaceae bacterium]|nr:hypothetical protein [Nannocystaceae bacterium]